MSLERCSYPEGAWQSKPRGFHSLEMREWPLLSNAAYRQASNQFGRVRQDSKVLQWHWGGAFPEFVDIDSMPRVPRMGEDAAEYGHDCEVHHRVIRA